MCLQKGLPRLFTFFMNLSKWSTRANRVWSSVLYQLNLLDNTLIGYFLVGNKNASVIERQRVAGDGSGLPEGEHHPAPAQTLASRHATLNESLVIATQNSFLTT